MTFQRKTIILSAVAAALLILFVLGSLFSPDRMRKTASATKLFPGFNKDAAARIELTGAGSTVTLQKSAGWVVKSGNAEYPAAEAKIGFLLDGIAQLTAGTVVTRKAESAPTFGFGSPEEVRIAVFGSKGETLCELSAGKTGSAGRGKYIRVGTNPEIHETGEELSPYVNAGENFWQNLKVFSQDVKSADVVRVKVAGKISLSGGKETRILSYELVRGTDETGGETWSAAGQGGAAVDAQKVKNAVDSLLAWEGNTISAEPKAIQETAAKPGVTVTLSLADSRTYALFVGERTGEDQYPCVLQNRAYCYYIPEWRISQALAARESLN